MSSGNPLDAIFAALPADLTRYVPLAGADLAAFVDRELTRFKGLELSATPREQLRDISLFQRVQDLAFVGQLRAIASTVKQAPVAQREFVADEVALCVNAGWMTGENLVKLAMRTNDLPGLLESVETGGLTSRHVRLVVDVLHEVDLTQEQRRAIVLVLLARFDGQTPGELLRVLRKLITRIDATAAKRRQEKAAKERHVDTYPGPDGRGSLFAEGPMEQIAQIRAALDAAMAAEVVPAGDTRELGEREFDLLVELICGKAERGHWQVQVIVPYSTAAGGELELAEIPGFGAVLPSTARDITDLAGAMTQIAVDAQTGDVLGVSDSLTVPTKPADPVVAATLARLLTKPVHRDPTVLGYRASRRLERILEARDRTCVFPGCHVPAMRTDKDHRIPWPRGATTVAGMQCLCRRHHRAKQASFGVRVTSGGSYEWTTRGGWVFTRTPQGY